MADVQHSSLTGAELHEPKGVDAANAGEVYVADGLGSGTWTARQYHIKGDVPDISTASTVYVPIPEGGTVTKVLGVLEGALTTSDPTITIKDSDGNTMGTITVTQAGSAAGDIDFNDTLANNDVTANDYITVETDGASGTAERWWFTVTVLRND